MMPPEEFFVEGALSGINSLEWPECPEAFRDRCNLILGGR